VAWRIGRAGGRYFLCATAGGSPWQNPIRRPFGNPCADGAIPGSPEVPPAGLENRRSAAPETGNTAIFEKRTDLTRLIAVAETGGAVTD